MSNDIYTKWKIVCNNIVNNKSKDWKQQPELVEILEHLIYENANIYLENLINDGIEPELIRKMCSINDSVGNPEMKWFPYYVKCSPSSIRYFRQAYDICTLIKDKNIKDVNIIEVGGGYGGLNVILNALSSILKINIKNYFILDLPEAEKLQQYYLSNFDNIKNTKWIPGDTFGSTLSFNEEDKNILVSNYCLSEIADEYKTQYLNNILPKVHGGYLAWNWGIKDGLPAIRKEVPEVPDTSNGSGNTIITW